MNKPFAITSALLAAFGIVVIGLAIKGPAASPPPAPSCASDWTLCADNSEMANNYRGWSNAQVGCKIQADKQARYGTPEWASGYFSSFRPGTNYKSGIVTLIDDRSKFQNGFGAMARVEVVCEYDLRSTKVINLTISAL